MTIAERYAGKVPEDEHETPFLVVHVPTTIISNFDLMLGHIVELTM